MTATFQPPPCAVRPDFADWVPPLLVKSFRQGMRSRVFVGVYLWTQISLALLVGMQVIATDDFFRRNLHFWQWIDMYLVLVIMVPLWPVFVQDEDARPEALDLIRFTGVPAQKIATGKLVCVVSQAVLLGVSMLPYELLCYHLGGIEVTIELEAFVWLMANLILLAPWGILLGGVPAGGRIALAPLLIVALLYVLAGLVQILLTHHRGFWFPWLAVAPVACIVGTGLAGARYEERQYY